MTTEQDQILQALSGLRDQIVDLREHVNHRVHDLELKLERGLNDVRITVGSLEYITQETTRDFEALKAKVAALETIGRKDYESVRREINQAAEGFRDRFSRLEEANQRSRGQYEGEIGIREKIGWSIATLLALGGLLNLLGVINV